jgi:hypothetical protein
MRKYHQGGEVYYEDVGDCQIIGPCRAGESLQVRVFDAKGNVIFETSASGRVFKSLEGQDHTAVRAEIDAENAVTADALWAEAKAYLAQRETS